MLQIFIYFLNSQKKYFCVKEKEAFLGLFWNIPIGWIKYSAIEASEVKMTINFGKTNPSRLKTLITGIR